VKESFFRLRSQFTEEIIFKKNSDFKDRKIKLKVSHKLEINNIDETSSSVRLIFNIFTEEELAVSPFFISITQLGEFEYPSDLDRTDLENLLNINAPAVLLSYIRGLISQITAFSGYPALIIPLINFAK
jgi:preprotein translocase subunit secB